MSDNLLLTSLWLVPLIGLVVVLVVPKRSEPAVKWVSLGFTSVTFLITLVVLGVYLTGDPHRPAPLRERVAHNKLVAAGRRRARPRATSRAGRERPGRPPRVDPVFQHPVLPGRGWDQPEPGGVDRPGQRAGVPGLVEHRQAGQGLLRAVLAACAPA